MPDTLMHFLYVKNVPDKKSAMGHVKKNMPNSNDKI